MTESRLSVCDSSTAFKFLEKSVQKKGLAKPAKKVGEKSLGAETRGETLGSVNLYTSGVGTNKTKENAGWAQWEGLKFELRAAAAAAT